MKITAIKQQVKRADRYSIYGDGKYLFSLSEAELLNSGLKLNLELNDQELSKLKDTAVIDKGYDRALDLVSRRPRSEWELQDYFRRKAYDPDVAQTIIDKLRDRGYVDDEQFAQRWVANRRLLKPVSRRRLAQELRQKRVADEIIEKVLASDETDDLTVLQELIERKRKQTKYQDDLKLMQFLARQGFTYEAIKSSMQEIKE